ncbi:hypothetical protein SAMN05216328_14832 [Ensifer sp. YR511]|nr:hypothetical protein SAMN05216328_14832 [Ensifer sp. YR511]
MIEEPHARYHRHRFPAEIIAHAVWLYYRFPLSLRDVEDLLAERGCQSASKNLHAETQATGRGRAEIEASEQPRRIGDLSIVLSEFGKIRVVVRFREGADTLDGSIERLPVDQVEDGSADSVIRRFQVEDDDRRIPQLQRCSIEVAQ